MLIYVDKRNVSYIIGCFTSGYHDNGDRKMNAVRYVYSTRITRSVSKRHRSSSFCYVKSYNGAVKMLLRHLFLVNFKHSSCYWVYRRNVNANDLSY